MIQKKDSGGAVIQSVAYDAKGRAKTITTSGVGTATNLSYDPYDYRIAKTDSTGSRRYLLEGEHLEGTMSGSDWKAMYLRGAVIDEIVNAYHFESTGWTNYTFHHDALQSVLGLSGHQGSVLQTIQYGPFGEKINITGSAPANYLHYTGRETDPDTELYNYRARLYDPSVGRFITEDPKGFEAGINFYVYVLNNPVNANDPSGLIGPAAIPLYYLGAKVLALGAAYAGVQAATHAPGVIGEVASWLGFDDVGKRVSTTFQDPGKLGNRIWSGALEANRVQLQTALELSPIDPLVDVTSVALGMDLTAVHINSQGQFVIPQMQSPDRSVTGLLVGSELGFKTVGSLLEYNALSQVGNRFGVLETGLSIYSAIDNTNLSRAWESSSSGSSSASGGFVLYPNKPNTNMMRSVYSK